MALHPSYHDPGYRKLFLIDSLGALLSAFMLGVVLVKFESVFGMPRTILYYLSFTACIFFTYSLVCYLSKIQNWQLYMKMIGVSNLLFSCFTIGLVVYLLQKLTVVGLTYFILEVIIVVILAAVELKAAFE